MECSDELCPDGITITLEWDEMERGMSVFVPAINTERLIKQFKQISQRKGWSVEHRVRIEGSLQGVRFWRML